MRLKSFELECEKVSRILRTTSISHCKGTHVLSLLNIILTPKLSSSSMDKSQTNRSKQGDPFPKVVFRMSC